MTKGITSLDSLLETRRLIRSMRINSDRNTKDLKVIKASWNNNKSTQQSRRLKEHAKAATSTILRDSKNNIKLAQHVNTILNTHLYERTNLNNKLQRQAKMILAENEELRQSSEAIMEGLATKLDSPLNLIVADLTKRFSRDLNVTAKTLLEEDFTYGVLALKSPTDVNILFCVIIVKDEGNFFKTFLNELPTNLTDKNFTPFASPSQAYKAIKDILVQDGILR